ncbi:hypothetical protein [Pacificibacter marinus]|uniref:Uncharacterized protein n=1 Tax=Pacificibacter marinus TaxID=658057 RepID=A0A1Y5RAR6_9RHOB|nr:hypothetical protein [Pacificibacter marinus]SEK29387.1 hypothetical protein SAMN04488032_101631 [Pacificibacter marinus]SLN10365.1 hypothetical protein PAM7971_00016 [Pacificibacter marinus]
MSIYEKAADQLAHLYNTSFGGKPKGRFRIASKQVREILGRKRLYSEDTQALTRACFEEGLVLIDMDSFFVVLSANTFVNYRRVSGEALSGAQSKV